MDNEVTGLVGGIQKFSVEDGPGIRTTVFLKGCPLNCAWCHNPELIDRKQHTMFSPNRCIACFECAKVCQTGAIMCSDNRLLIERSLCKNCMSCTKVCFSGAMSAAGKTMSVPEIMKLVLQDKGYYQRTGGGLTISGGEVLTQADFAEALLDAAKAEGINVAIDTCGFGDFAKLKRLAEKCEYILYDMKLIDAAKHRQYTNADNKPILEALERLAADTKINRKILIRMPLVHEVNDTTEIIEQTLAFLLANKLHQVTLLPYHELGVAKKRNLGLEVETFSPPSAERLAEIKALFTEHGIHTEILGQAI